MLTDTPGGGQNWTPMVGHFSMPFDTSSRMTLPSKCCFGIDIAEMKKHFSTANIESANVKRLILLLFVLVNMAANASALSLLPEALVIGEKEYRVHDRHADSDTFAESMHGYYGEDYSGYYLGTISGNTDGRNKPLESIISYYYFLIIGHEMPKSDIFKVEKSSQDDYGVNGLLMVSWADDYKSGTWSINDPASSLIFYAIKGANEFALYFVDPAGQNGLWTSRHLLNNRGNIPEISHFVGVDPPLAAPEPNSLLMLVFGLTGLGFVARCRQGR